MRTFSLMQPLKLLKLGSTLWNILTFRIAALEGNSMPEAVIKRMLDPLQNLNIQSISINRGMISKSILQILAMCVSFRAQLYSLIDVFLSVSLWGHVLYNSRTWDRATSDRAKFGIFLYYGQITRQIRARKNRYPLSLRDSGDEY